MWTVRMKRQQSPIEWLEDEANWTWEGPEGEMFSLRSDDCGVCAMWPVPNWYDDLDNEDGPERDETITEG